MSWLSNIFSISKRAAEKTTTSSVLITPEQLKQIASTLKDGQTHEMSELINELCTKYGIIELVPFRMFIANVVQESGEFSAKQENMNYKAETLMKVWPKRFPDLVTAKQYEHKPQQLANYVYGNRMGNTDPNDGWQYRGGGFIGLTGKEVYTQYAKHIGKDVSFAADLVRSENRYALDSACWFFAILKKLIPVANTGNFVNVVKGINGGTIGLSTRQHYYELAKKYIQ